MPSRQSASLRTNRTFIAMADSNARTQRPRDSDESAAMTGCCAAVRKIQNGVNTCIALTLPSASYTPR